MHIHICNIYTSLSIDLSIYLFIYTHTINHNPPFFPPFLHKHIIVLSLSPFYIIGIFYIFGLALNHVCIYIYTYIYVCVFIYICTLTDVVRGFMSDSIRHNVLKYSSDVLNNIYIIYISHNSLSHL
jgi:hypothetical protein